jgi:hypothetical protein
MLQWRVRIWLADQSIWYLELPRVAAVDEDSAITRAKRDLAAGWQAIFAQVEYAPASAQCLGAAGNPANPSPTPKPTHAASRTPEGAAHGRRK